MVSTIKRFLKLPTTIVGIVTALMFQLIFSIVWMTGYDGVTERLDRLTVGIVNEDAGFGAQVVRQMQSSLPMKTEVIPDLAQAERLLDERELQMVAHIPADFSAKASASDQVASINYTLNESNPALIKSMMTAVSAQVTSAVNKAVIEQGVGNVLSQQAKLPQEQAAAAAAALSERVKADVRSVNPVEGMSSQMVPMMMVLASYVGAMIMGMNMEQSSMSLTATIGRWQRFAARSLINVGAAIIVSLAGASLVLLLGGQAEHGFWMLWSYQFVVVLTFLFVAQLFLLLFGIPGMLFNIILLSAQLVSSGALVPRELLPDTYVALGQMLPATYAVEGGMNVLFGGPGVGASIGGLLSIMAAALGLGALAVVVRRGKKPSLSPVQAKSLQA